MHRKYYNNMITKNTIYFDFFFIKLNMANGWIYLLRCMFVWKRVITSVANGYNSDIIGIRLFLNFLMTSLISSLKKKKKKFTTIIWTSYSASLYELLCLKVSKSNYPVSSKIFFLLSHISLSFFSFFSREIEYWSS